MAKLDFWENIGGQNSRPTSLNYAQNEVIHHFLEFGSLVFFKNACNDSLQQYLKSSRSKTQEKNLGGEQIWAKRVKIRSKTSFLVIFSSLVH